jgi:hypothetical protein
MTRMGFAHSQESNSKGRVDVNIAGGSCMTAIEKFTRTCLLLTLVWLPVVHLRADGGYVSKTEAVAISADQRAIIIKDCDEISMTFSTGYTGDGQEFGWIIPTPVPPVYRGCV